MNLTIVIKPKVIRKPKAGVRLTNKLTQARVIKEDGEYKAYIDIPTDDIIKPKLIIPFTKRSYNLKGRRDIFSKEKGEHGYIRYVRDESKAKYFDVDEEIYVPFAPNWLVSGYIVKLENGSKAFDFKDIIKPYGYEISSVKSWER